MTLGKMCDQCLSSVVVGPCPSGKGFRLLPGAECQGPTTRCRDSQGETESPVAGLPSFLLFSQLSAFVAHQETQYLHGFPVEAGEAVWLTSFHVFRIQGERPLRSQGLPNAKHGHADLGQEQAWLPHLPASAGLGTRPCPLLQG